MVAATLVGSSEEGRWCLVTTKDFLGLWILFMDLVVILWGCGTACGISEMVFCDEGKEEGFRLLT